jgi:D-glycero-D-manno-heptose 1,7-bisphosphate phosphatase
VFLVDDKGMDAAHVRFVFLDRDGVINRKPPEGDYVRDWACFAWLPGAVEAIAAMTRAGLTVMVVTNQRGVSLGLYTVEQLESIHREMQTHLAQHGARVNAIYYCPHDRGVCRCRKPGSGMFEQAFQEFSEAGPHNSVMIGDSLSDIQAGNNLGMQTIFIQGEPDRQAPGAVEAAALASGVAESLLEAVEQLMLLGR